MTIRLGATDLTRSLREMFDDLPYSEILMLQEIMIKHGLTDPNCFLIDQITNWVYEDTQNLMPVACAYEYVMSEIYNE